MYAKSGILRASMFAKDASLRLGGIGLKEILDMISV